MKTFDVVNLDWEVVRIMTTNKPLYAVYNTKTGKFYHMCGERYLTEEIKFAQEHVDRLNSKGDLSLR